MFIKRFFRVSAEQTLKERLTYLYVDFRNPSTNPAGVDRFILSKLRDALLRLNGLQVPGESGGTFDFESTGALEQIFWPHMQRLQTGPEGDLKKVAPTDWEKLRLKKLADLRDDDSEFVKGAIRVLKQRYHRQVVVIIDNADVCTEDYQRAVYLYARTLLNDIKAPMIVALREEWYWHFNRGGGPRTAFHDMVFHVPCPRARDVIRRRLDYSIDLIRNSRLPSPTFHIHGLAVQAESLIKYPGLNFEVQHWLVANEALIGGFVSMSFSGSVV